METGMKTFFVTAGAACLVAAVWATPSLSASSNATTNANGTVTDTTNAATGTNGASTSSSTDANASGSASGNAQAGGTSASAGATAGTSTSMDIKQIDVNRPFGDTTVDSTKSPKDIDATLTDTQRNDLQMRCNTIVENGSMFQADVPTFCTQYLAYWKQSHPAQ